MLKDLLGWAAETFPPFAPTAQTKVALSAYNAGERNALRGHARGDSDRYTTWRDYARDVQAREKAFGELLAGV